MILKKKGWFDSTWLPPSSASLNRVEPHCLLDIPNSDRIIQNINVIEEYYANEILQ